MSASVGNPTSSPAEATSGGRVGLAHETFTLRLDKVIDYKDGPKDLECQFTYYWDFVRNEGLAHLTAVDGGSSAPLPIVLNPAGIEGTLSFLGANQTTPVPISGGQPIIFYRVWLILENGTRKAAIMLDPSGDTILATQNYGGDAAILKA